MNVVLDLMMQNHPDTNTSTEDEGEEKSLAQIKFLSSNLRFESYSDGSKDVDLESREIRMVDTRFLGKD